MVGDVAGVVAAVRAAYLGREPGPRAEVPRSWKAVDVAHFGEHLAQMVEIHWLDWAAAKGIAGELDVESVHFWWNTMILAAGLAWMLLRRGLALTRVESLALLAAYFLTMPLLLST